MNCPNNQIAEPIAIDIPSTGNRIASFIAGGQTVEPKAVLAIERGEIKGFQKVLPAEHHIGRARAPGPYRAHNHVGKAIAVYVARTNRPRHTVPRRLLLELEAILAIEGGKVDDG